MKGCRRSKNEAACMSSSLGVSAALLTLSTRSCNRSLLVCERVLDENAGRIEEAVHIYLHGRSISSPLSAASYPLSLFLSSPQWMGKIAHESFAITPPPPPRTHPPGIRSSVPFARGAMWPRTVHVLLHSVA